MQDEIAVTPTDWRLDHDFFHHHVSNFERDVHILVLGALEAGVKYLDAELEKVKREYADKERYVSPENEDWFINDYLGETGNLENQKRFMRNMAAVGLLSLLTHALHKLADMAEEMSPRDPDPKRAYVGENEFQKLWDEYRKRFGITMQPGLIQWIEGLRRARNLIVHNGGEANPAVPYCEVTADTPFDELWDTSFSSRYPRYVQGQSFNAEVNIPEAELDKCVGKAVELVKWLGGQLRAKQLAVRAAQKA